MIQYKIIVLDDDPTGTQTVHDIQVYTDWEEETLQKALNAPGDMFFVLTNSRSFSREHTAQVHRKIGERISKLCKKEGLEPIVVLRGDSTLRGHFPTEGEALVKGLGMDCDGEVIMPFFPEGGRFTQNDIHYVRQSDGSLLPAGETEFAKDKTFGYHASDLKEWVEEKTEGRCKAEDCISIPIGMDEEEIYRRLRDARHFRRIIVNAMDYGDVRHFVNALRRALDAGKHFVYRTAAGFPKVLGNVSDMPLLDANQICARGSLCGGLVIIGSHVPKTTRQLAALRAHQPNLAYYEFDAAQAMAGSADELAEKAAAFAAEHIRRGTTAVIYTSRKRIDLPGVTPEEQLKASVEVSRGLTSIPERLGIRPRYLIAKGGITSSDIATGALRIQSAKVLGQAAPGIPVWLCGEESLYPGMAYIIFPGNVGEDETLAEIVDKLENRP